MKNKTLIIIALAIPLITYALRVALALFVETQAPDDGLVPLPMFVLDSMIYLFDYGTIASLLGAAALLFYAILLHFINKKH